MTLTEFQKELNSLNRWAQHGCGNHGCIIKPPTGLGTNMTCQCYPEKFSEVLLNLAAAIEPKNKYERFKLDCPKETL
jgi:hypothetical protein